MHKTLDAFVPVGLPIGRPPAIRSSRGQFLMVDSSAADDKKACSRRAVLRTSLTGLAFAAVSTLPLQPSPAQAEQGPARPKPSSATASKPPKLRFVRDDSGISYADVKVGSGPAPADGDFVIVDWVAYLSDGTVFDNTTSPGRNSVVFRMGQHKVIPGLEIALSTMKQGGVRKVIVPPNLAYGEKGVCLPEKGCLIPPNEILEYDITLNRVAISPL